MKDRVVIVTGGGRGIGREECLLFASAGAKVVVNDRDEDVAGEVVALIEEAGGQAVSSAHDITRFDDAKGMVDLALETFGDLHVLVNNAGITRDRMVFSMSEEEFDSVIAVHLKGHFNCTRWASAYFRAESKKGVESARAIVNTTSGSGLLGNPGQTNYGAAKAGIAALTQIWGRELQRYGVRVNAIAPIARTRMTEATFGALEVEEGEFDVLHPGNVAPLVVYLASDHAADINGEVFGIRGGELERYTPWQSAKSIDKEQRWTVEEIAERIKELY